LGKNRILTPSDVTILTAFADTLIPPTDRLPQKPSELNLAEDIEDQLFYSSATLRRAFQWGLRYLNARAFFYRFSGVSLARMEEGKRRDYLETWFHSPLLYRRVLIRLLEAYVFTSYYAHPEVNQVLGYRLKRPNKTPSKVLYGENVVSALSKDEDVEADVCVIGSGAGGAPLASDLAEAGLKVVILEEGGRFDLSDYQVDAAHRSKRMYRDGGLTTTLGVPPIVIPLGRTIGGTTTINSGTCFRTPEAIFEKWRIQFGLSEFSSEALAPYFEKAEKTIHVMETPEEILGGSAKVIRRGMEKMGLHGAPLKRNIKGCEGSGLCCFGCPTDGKQSVQLNYIPQALQDGARLYAHCRVEKVFTEGGRATEAVARFVHPVTREKGASLRVRAKVFVLAAGTVHTPLLLQASGLGLRSGQLGRNLTIHPTGKVLALFEEQINGWEGVPQSYSCADFADQGIMFEGAFTPPSIASTGFLLRGKAHKEVMENFSRIACFGFLVTDESRGRVRRKPSGEPLIFYSLGKADLQKIIQGTVLLCRIFFEAGAKRVYLPIHSLPVMDSIDEVSWLHAKKIQAKDLEVLAFHPLGTCRMGRDPARSVVDSNGRLHEIDNLFVCDGSIFPSSLGVNPQVTIMALSHRTAEHIRRNYF
jgi:GMC oxidoreductase